MTITLKNEFLTVTIDDLGAQLCSVVNTDGSEYIWQADPAVWGRHAPLLFPVIGRLQNGQYTVDGETYAISAHGFARDSEFELVEALDDSLTLVLRQNEQTAKIYPFDFTLSVKYSLCDSELTMTIEVKNDSAKTMPYMIGWHPGFNIDGLIDNYFIKVKNADTVKRNYMKPSLFIEPEAVDYPLSDGIFKLTEKEIYGEDTLIFSDIGGESLLMRGEKTILRIKQSDNLPYYAIWKAPKSGAEYICLEPWSDIPADGVTPECFDNRKMSRLDAGKSETYVFTVEFAD